MVSYSDKHCNNMESMMGWAVNSLETSFAALGHDRMKLQDK